MLAWPTWSPDGRYLAYPVPCDNGCLAVRSATTGQVRRLAPAMKAALGAAVWSPDGRSLLAVSRSGQVVVRIDVQSGEATHVTNDVSGAPVGWSPDGTKVYLIRGDAAVEQELVSGSERIVHREPGGIVQAQLSPDGRHVFAVLRLDWSDADRRSAAGADGRGPGPGVAPAERRVWAWALSVDTRQPRGDCPEEFDPAWNSGGFPSRVIGLASSTSTQVSGLEGATSGCTGASACLPTDAASRFRRGRPALKSGRWRTSCLPPLRAADPGLHISGYLTDVP